MFIIDKLINKYNERVVLDMALVNRWPLIADANDVVGGLNLTNNGGVTFDGDGAHFNGSNQWLSGTKTIPSSVTMSVWITPVNFSARRSVLVMTGDGGDDCIGWVSLSNNITTMALCCGSGATGGYLSISSELNITNYPTDRKTLSVVTLDRTQNLFSVYRNSTLLGTFTRSANLSGTYLAIGRFGAYATDGYWYGTLMDARIYDHALSQEEVVKLYNNGPNYLDVHTNKNFSSLISYMQLPSYKRGS